MNLCTNRERERERERRKIEKMWKTAVRTTPMPMSVTGKRELKVRVRAR
jgi:hypothetical protein